MGNYSTTVAHWAPLPPVLGVLMDYLCRYAFESPLEHEFLRVGKFRILSGTSRSWGPITFHFAYGSSAPAAPQAGRIAIGQHREKPAWNLDVKGNFELLDVESKPVANAPEPPGTMRVKKLGFMPQTSTNGVAVCRAVGMKMAVTVNMNGAAEQQIGAADRVGRAMEPMFDGMIVQVLNQLTAAARDSYAADILNRVIRSGYFDYFSVQVSHLESLVRRAGSFGSPEFKEFAAFGTSPEAYVKARTGAPQTGNRVLGAGGLG